MNIKEYKQSARIRAREIRKLGPGEHRRAVTSNEAGLALRSIGEVAAILGCSPQAVHQTERMALHKLRLLLWDELAERNSTLAATVLEREQKTLG